jgi:hypothetical protein
VLFIARYRATAERLNKRAGVGVRWYGRTTRSCILSRYIWNRLWHTLGIWAFYVLEEPSCECVAHNHGEAKKTNMFG